MMFYLHRLSDQIGGFNVFFYVTFRAVAAAITAFVVSLLFGNFVIHVLTALKLGQPIRQAAEVHRLAELHGGKQGTPTMGGVLVIGAVFISSFLWARPDNRFVWLALFAMVYLGVLGFVDDYLKVTKKKSDGVSGRIKLLFQITVAHEHGMVHHLVFRARDCRIVERGEPDRRFGRARHRLHRYRRVRLRLSHLRCRKFP